MSVPHTILVIDDDADIRENLKIVLESGGFRVVSAESATAGAALVASEKPDLVLLDIIMEEVDAGFVLAEKIGPNVPVVLLSSIADSAVKVFDANKLPVREVLQKPVKPAVLLEKVNRHLAATAKK
jgi:two-component system, OmpR family, response regulator